MCAKFAIGERVIWLSGLGIEYSIAGIFSPVDAEVVRMAHGRVLIRVTERASGQHAESFVERWVEPGALRKRRA